LLALSFVVFAMLRLVPGDPAVLVLGPEASPQALQALREQLGLDQPIVAQFVAWLRRAITGDLGLSLRFKEPVMPLIVERYPRTLSLVIWGSAVAISISLVAGATSARRNNSWIDLSITSAALLGISVPGFWLGALLMLAFSVNLGWLPTSGYAAPGKGVAEFLKHLVMPGTALGLAVGAVLTRMVRSSLLDVYLEPYIVAARAKGLAEATLFYRHALRNALIPVVTLFGIHLGYMMGGTVVMEKMFAYPGIGTLILEALFQRDYPVVQAGILSYATTFILINLITDVAYSAIDPRVTLTGKGR
jgi:peptide/nickel transport system permease protein